MPGGVQTFDGNAQVHDSSTSNVTLQLCVTRNRRRSSAKRYKGAAQITSHRARKGF